MERYCGDIGHHIKSRRLPYSTINKYVTSQAQLTQVTLLYGLHDQLSLHPPPSHNNELRLPSCKSFIVLIYNLITDFSNYNLDPLYVLTSQKPVPKTLSKPLW